jgi:hypothetical protein
VRAGRAGMRRNHLEGGLSKLSSMVEVEVDVLPGEPGHRTAYGSSFPQSRNSEPFNRHRRAKRLRE